MRPQRPLHASPASATDALVVRISDYAESSAVVSLVTSDRGAVSAVARGARRARNSFRGPLDVGVLYRVRLGNRGGDRLAHLNSAEVLDAFAQLRRSPPRFHAASLVLEVAADLMRENQPHPELFRLTVFFLKVLDRAPDERVALATTLFLARAVHLSGHAPEIGCCVACGRPVDAGERPLIAPLRGGLLHADCAQGEPGARSVRPEVLDALHEFLDRPAAEVLAREGDPDPVRLRDLRLLLVDWLQHTLERRFRAAGPTETVFARTLRKAAP